MCRKEYVWPVDDTATRQIRDGTFRLTGPYG
jgi:hypothetical protein